MPTREEFEKRRRGRPATSQYRAFLRSLRPGEVGEWPIKEGQKPESARSAFWWAAVQEGIKIETTVQGEVLWILVPEPVKPPRRTRKEKNPG